MPSYLGIPWLGSFSLSPDLEEKIVTMATEHDTEGGNKQLGLSIKVERSETCEIILYAPYWIINKTALPLQIRVILLSLLLYYAPVFYIFYDIYQINCFTHSLIHIIYVFIEMYSHVFYADYC